MREPENAERRRETKKSGKVGETEVAEEGGGGGWGSRAAGGYF